MAGGHIDATRAGADEDQLAHEFGRLKGDLLSDVAADRIAEHVGLANPSAWIKAIAPSPSPGSSSGFCPTLADAGIVEQDHFALLGEAVGHRRIPMVHRASEMLVKDDRHAAGLAEAAIGEADADGFDELGRDRIMGIGGHGEISLWVDGSSDGRRRF